MLENFWHRKEKPFQGFGGFGGGATGLSAAGLSATPGMEATGGIMHDYESPTGDFYRIHTFIAPGTFTVSSLSDEPTYNAIDYLLVGGGGGGANTTSNPAAGFEAAGGGAGAVIRQGVSSTKPVSTSPGAYDVVIGHGGAAYVLSLIHI